MKRLLEYPKVKWLYEGETLRQNTMITFEAEEIPLDLDLTGFKIEVDNILWPNCYGRVSEFDGYGNLVKLKFPKYFQQFILSVRKQTYKSVITHLDQQLFEDDMTSKGKEIQYDNILGLDFRSQITVEDAIKTAWDTCRFKGFEPNIGAKELAKHLVKFLSENQKK